MPRVASTARSSQRLPVYSFVATVATALIGMPFQAEAATLQLGPLTFSEAGGDFTLKTGSLTNGEFVIQQDIFGPNINLFIAIDGLRSACSNSNGCFFTVQSIVTNQTASAWTFFDQELQEAFGIPSSDLDGLSFAQGNNSLRPFTSNRFTTVDEVTDVRDFVNFSGGIISPGEQVTLRYVIADTTPSDRFYLLQRPNFQVVSGFVTPTPVVTITPTPVIDPTAVTGSQPELSIVTSPSPVEQSAAVPEPTTWLGVVVVSAIAARIRTRQSHSQK